MESPQRSDFGGRGKEDKTMGDYIKKFLNLALPLGSQNVWNRLPLLFETFTKISHL